ncbi:MAG: DUF3467 domain-containing protein [Planctomycetes bacterium]|jgi:hypothetical protein|nr:DUF3467 domain-containing protein [Phycisphaerae bacterium]NBB95480.1 DUF3467 domain-containing protein [Planctomycetota bacterium]
MAEANTPENNDAQAPEDQAREQTGQRQVRLRVNQSDMETSYANAFRANATAEELMIDFGINFPIGGGEGQNDAEIAFQVTNRIVLNLYSAKRLALTLGQIVRRHEQEFGELQLDVSKRRQGAG